MRTPSTRTLQRVIAVTLTTLFSLVLTTSAFAVPVDSGGDFGACGSDLWQKADWNSQTDSWDWEDGPGWDDDTPAPATPTLAVANEVDGDPITVVWASSAPVLSVTVKAATQFKTFDTSSGTAGGVVTGIDKTDDPADGQYAISHIVFCYGPAPVLVPSIGLEKTPDVETITYAPDDGDDETVTYTYVVTNTGETALTSITLVDDVLGTITLPVTDLAVGASTTGTATHVVTAADADAGQILNTAVVTGLAPDQTTVDATDTATVLVEEVAPVVILTPEVSLEKSALVTPDDDGRKVVTWSESAPTDTQVTYEYVITNTGETALTGIALVDDVLGTITLTDTDLAAGESMTVTAVHTVTEADATAGTVTNVAVVTGTDPDGAQVDATAEETVLVAEVQGEVIDREPEPSVIEEKAEPSVAEEKAEQLPVTGAATAMLAIVASLSLATGTGLLRASRRKE